MNIAHDSQYFICRKKIRTCFAVITLSP